MSLSERESRSPLPESQPIPQKTLVEAKAFPTPQPFPRSPPHDWKRMQQEYLFYAPGLMYAHVRLDRDPFLEFQAWKQRSFSRWQLVGPKTWFLGLGDGHFTWGNILHVVSQDCAEEWLRFLNSLGYWDRAASLFIRIGIQWVDLWDPWCEEGGNPIRSAAVILSTTRGRILWDLPSGPGHPCRPRFLNPDPGLLEFAKRFTDQVGS